MNGLRSKYNKVCKINTTLKRNMRKNIHKGIQENLENLIEEEYAYINSMPFVARLKYLFGKQF
jgi:hypothetical protein